jgi:hypothetical protein
LCPWFNLTRDLGRVVSKLMEGRAKPAGRGGFRSSFLDGIQAARDWARSNTDEGEQVRNTDGTAPVPPTRRANPVGGANEVRRPPVVAINKWVSAKTGWAKTWDISSKLVRMAPSDASKRYTLFWVEQASYKCRRQALRRHSASDCPSTGPAVTPVSQIILPVAGSSARTAPEKVWELITV